MKEQTAVEWLKEQLKDDRFLSAFEEEFEQAKEMEKQQIIDARISAPLLNTGDRLEYVKEAEQYYNETFNQKEGK